MTKPKLHPTAGHALIKPIGLDKKTASGIVLPDTHDEKSQKGKVIAMGKKTVRDGVEIKAEFKIGQTVIYKKWGGDEIKFGISGEDYIFVKFEDVLAVLE